MARTTTIQIHITLLLFFFVCTCNSAIIVGFKSTILFPLYMIHKPCLCYLWVGKSAGGLIKEYKHLFIEELFYWNFLHKNGIRAHAWPVRTTLGIMYTRPSHLDCFFDNRYTDIGIRTATVDLLPHAGSFFPILLLYWLTGIHFMIS